MTTVFLLMKATTTLLDVIDTIDTCLVINQFHNTQLRNFRSHPELVKMLIDLKTEKTLFQLYSPYIKTSPNKY